jgi:hypothetical protein
MLIRVAIFCTSLITENCILSISNYIEDTLHFVSVIEDHLHFVSAVEEGFGAEKRWTQSMTIKDVLEKP